MNARRRHLRAAACLTLVGLLACLPLAAAFGSVNEDDMVLRLSAAERALPPDRLPDFDASCAALMDEDGTLWFGRNADDAAQIASLTKIMTAIVAADWLDASTMIEVTPEAASVGESSAGLAQGDSMTFDDALKALLTLRATTRRRPSPKRPERGCWRRRGRAATRTPARRRSSRP